MHGERIKTLPSSVVKRPLFMAQDTSTIFEMASRLYDELDSMSNDFLSATKPVTEEVNVLKVVFINQCRQVLYGQTIVEG
ncbi:MAG: hypothetical protein KIT10_11700 [Flavobacteriales bacterium]|nr:hypothetical protein [Flavobacteriales bacterium]